MQLTKQFRCGDHDFPDNVQAALHPQQGVVFRKERVADDGKMNDDQQRKGDVNEGVPDWFHTSFDVWCHHVLHGSDAACSTASVGVSFKLVHHITQRDGETHLA